MAHSPPPPPPFPSSHMSHMYPSPYYPCPTSTWHLQKNPPPYSYPYSYPYPYPYPYPSPTTAPATYAHDSPLEGSGDVSFVQCEGRGEDYDERRTVKRPRVARASSEEVELMQARIAEQRKLTQAEREAMGEEARRRMEETRLQREAEMKELQAQQAVMSMQHKLARILGYVKEEGLTLDRFFIELMASKDQMQSSQVSRMLNNHGMEMAQAMVDRKPKVLEPWMKSKVADMYSADKKKLKKKLRVDQKKSLKAAFVHLQQWQVMDDLQRYSPAIWEVLERLRTLEEPEPSQPSVNPEPAQKEDAPVDSTNTPADATSTSNTSNSNDKQ